MEKMDCIFYKTLINFTNTPSVNVELLLPEEIEEDTFYKITRITSKSSDVNAFVKLCSNSLLSDKTYNSKLKSYNVLESFYVNSALTTSIYPPEAMTAYTNALSNGTYVVSVSGVWGAPYYGWKAFEKQPLNNSYWIAPANYSTPSGDYAGGQITVCSGVNYPGEWAQIKLPYLVAMTSIKYYTPVGYVQYSVKSFAVAGSLDGTTWTYLNTCSNTNFSSLTLSLNNTTPFLYYRFIILTKGSVSNYCMVNELEFIADSTELVFSKEVNEKSKGIPVSPNLLRNSQTDFYLLNEDYTEITSLIGVIDVEITVFKKLSSRSERDTKVSNM
jgi:hypothetical protein